MNDKVKCVFPASLREKMGVDKLTSVDDIHKEEVDRCWRKRSPL